MTTLTLHRYLQKIDQLLDDNRFSEAADHCRHILEQVPRHVATYRALARALLEQHQYENAADLFKRVLSADPNDLLAHVGLADIYKQDTLLDQSLWHLERAFELEPYNPIIQDELRHLYHTQHNDVTVARIPLNQGALARIYLKEELYGPAVSELRQALGNRGLGQNGDRVDLEVLLAEALWRDERRVDAAEVCRRVLQQLPNCIVANAILADIWLQTGRTGEAQRLLQLVQAMTQMDNRRLDQETAVGHPFTLEGAPTLPDEVKIELLQLVPEAGAPAAPTADWVSELSFPRETAEGAAAEETGAAPEYGWLAGLDEETGPAAATADFEDVAGLFGEGQPLSLDEMAEGDLELADSAAAPSWLSDETEADGDDQRWPTPEELPDWLEQAALAEDAADSLSTSDQETVEPDEIPSLPRGEMPDWLADISSADDYEPMAVDPTLASEWFSETGDEAAEREIESMTTAGEDEEWLAELEEHYDAGTGELDEGATAAGPAVAGEDSDWLAALTRDTDELPAQPGTGDEELWPAEFTDWLAEDTAEVEYEDEVADWLLGSNLTEQDQPEELMGTTSAGLPAAGLPANDSDKNDSSRQEAPEPKEEPSPELDETMAWLDALTAEQDEPEPAVIDQLAGETLPDWLADLSDPTGTEEEVAEAEPSVTPDYDDADIPDWLRASAPAGDDELPGPEEEEIGADAPGDEALSYLDPAIAAREGSPIDEPPTQVSVTSPEMTAEEDETAVTGWLSELENEGSQGEETESLDWLDQIAAGAAQPPVADEIPTLTWPDELDDEEPSLDWLSELAAPPDETLVNLEQAQTETDPAQGDQAEEDDTGVEAPLQPPVADLDDAMAWLEELAAQQGAPVEELPTVARVLESDSAAETTDEEEDLNLLPEPDEALAEAEVGLDETMAWLEDLVGQQDAAQLETWAEAEDLEGLEPPAQAATAADAVSAHDELEEALDWLEQVALEEGDPVEAASAAIDVTDDELEEALDWLEQIASGETEPQPEDAERAVVEVEPEISPHTPSAEDAVADTVAEPDDDLFDVPDDPEAALAWLEQLAAASEAEPEPESETEDGWDVPAEAAEASAALLSDELPEAFVADISQTDEEEAEPELDFLAPEAMPEDPDEAMAWLERLAARQGAPPEELPSVTAEEAQAIATLAETMPGRLQAEASITEEADVSDEANLIEVEPKMEWGAGEAEAELMSHPESPESAAGEATAAIGEERGAAGMEDQPTVAEAGSPEAQPELDVMGWLEAEEEATVIRTEEPAPVPETGPLFDRRPPEQPAAGQPPAAQPPVAQPPVAQPPVAQQEPEPDAEDQSLLSAEPEPVTSALALDEAQLAQAQQALAGADYDEAMHTYQSLVTRGEGLSTLIGDLETAVDRHPRQPLLRRVLGDAYMRNGQLQKALETYRQTLDHL